jgi:hypothetical protein
MRRLAVSNQSLGGWMAEALLRPERTCSCFSRKRFQTCTAKRCHTSRAGQGTVRRMSRADNLLNPQLEGDNYGRKNIKNTTSEFAGGHKHHTPAYRQDIHGA